MSRHRPRRSHRGTKSQRQKNQRHYKLMGQTMALTVALAASNALPQDADRRETFTLHRSMCRISVRFIPDERRGSDTRAERDIPQSITIIPQELMQEQAVTSFRDALPCDRHRSLLTAGEGGGGAGEQSHTLRV